MKALNVLLNDKLFAKEMLIIWGVTGILTFLWAMVTLGSLSYIFVKLGLAVTFITIIINMLVYKKDGRI